MAADIDALIADVRKTKPTIADVMQDAANYQTRAELEDTITALRSRIEELERELADMEEARDKAEEEGNKLNCMRAIAERERDEAIDALEPFAKVGAIVLGEAPPEATQLAIFTDCEARQHVVSLETFRRAASAIRALGKERT